MHAVKWNRTDQLMRLNNIGITGMHNIWLSSWYDSTHRLWLNVTCYNQHSHSVSTFNSERHDQSAHDTTVNDTTAHTVSADTTVNDTTHTRCQHIQQWTTRPHTRCQHIRQWTTRPHTVSAHTTVSDTTAHTVSAHTTVSDTTAHTVSAHTTVNDTNTHDCQHLQQWTTGPHTVCNIYYLFAHLLNAHQRRLKLPQFASRGIKNTVASGT